MHINQKFFITESEGVYFAVRPGSLNKNLSFVLNPYSANVENMLNS